MACRFLSPAITLAQYGCCIPERLARDWGKQRDKLRRNRAASELFLFGGETPRPVRCTSSPLSRARRRPSRRTARASSIRDSVAVDLIATLRQQGGVHAVEDFVEFAPEYVTPISVGYRGYDLWECPPNGQGIVPMLMVKGLEAFDLGKWSSLSARALPSPGRVRPSRLCRARRVRRRSAHRPGAGRVATLGSSYRRHARTCSLDTPDACRRTRILSSRTATPCSSAWLTATRPRLRLSIRFSRTSVAALPARKTGVHFS